jgi:hypothetical protein
MNQNYIFLGLKNRTFLWSLEIRLIQNSRFSETEFNANVDIGKRDCVSLAAIDYPPVDVDLEIM